MSARRRVLFLTARNVYALHEGVAAYAHEANWIFDNRMCYSGELPHGAQADGVICRHAFRGDVAEFTRQLGVPMVGFEHADHLPMPSVYYNDEMIGRRAAQHLLVRGYRALAFYHRHATPFQRLRMKGFRAEAEAAGAEFVLLEPAENGATDHEPDTSWDWLAQKLAQVPTPIGVMAINDRLASPLVDALLALGYRVPEQVAVVSAENDPVLCDAAAIPVSSVETCTRQVGYAAARLLDRLMDGASAPDGPLLVDPGDVQTRASTDMVAIRNLHAARALRFIWTHYREPITVDTVSAHVPVTRRRLQTLFREHMGRTMQEEIARVRTAEACGYLKETSVKIQEIAARTGFSSSLHLHRTFQSVLQMGPKAFRERGTMPEFGVLPAQVRCAESGQPVCCSATKRGE